MSIVPNRILWGSDLYQCNIQDGTLCLQPSPVPSPIGMCMLPTGAVGQASGLATAVNIEALATIIMSEASVGYPAERIAVGSTVINRMKRNHVTQVSAVQNGYAHTQIPVAIITKLATDLLNGTVADNTNGATHFYSPRKMPPYIKGKLPPKGFDTSGGVETVPGVGYSTYRPSWAITFQYVAVAQVRPAYYKFYRAPGIGPVQ